MFEKALSGTRSYWGWIFFLLVVIGVGFVCYLKQLTTGLGITGMSRDVSWGLYIAQLTFMVGIAASAVTVVLPYYLHDTKVFGRITILGEFLAIAAVTTCIAFVTVDLGQPGRALNLFLHPTPHSILFWDTVALGGYLVLNVIITHITLDAERTGEAPPKWIRPVIILSIPWAISIHTVTAFIYSGLAARPFWMTAILAPRFLASAFSAGPALLILFCLILMRFTRFDPGWKAIQKMALIVTYAMLANIFFILMEVFTTLYSDMPEHLAHLKYLYLGLDGHHEMVPFMWASAILAVFSAVVLVTPKLRTQRSWLRWACLAVVASIWLEKGLGMVVTGFVPSPLDTVTHYLPTVPEVLITLGIYALGALMVTGFYHIALAVRGELRSASLS